MLAEIFMLRLEAALRSADGQMSPSSDTRFVPAAITVNIRSDLKLSPTSKGRA
jgi:hypothetical protein